MDSQNNSPILLKQTPPWFWKTVDNTLERLISSWHQMVKEKNSIPVAKCYTWEDSRMVRKMALVLFSMNLDWLVIRDNSKTTIWKEMVCCITKIQENSYSMAPNIKEILSKEIFTLKIQPFRKQLRNERLCIIKELRFSFCFRSLFKNIDPNFKSWCQQVSHSKTNWFLKNDLEQKATN